MTSLFQHHPDDECLLRYADGELSVDQASEVQLHLKVCWQCRVRLAELEKVVEECVRYYQTVVAPHVPPPPAAWMNIRAELAALEQKISRPSICSRVWARLSAARRFRKPALKVALAATVLAMVFYQLYRAPSARAAELLQRAVNAEAKRTPKPRRIEIRFRGRHIASVVEGSHGAEDDHLSTEDRQAVDHLQRLFTTVRYRWTSPLSVAAFSDWRKTLSEKRDEVSVQALPLESGGSCYRLRTTTGSSSLAEATILLRTNDLQPIEGTWRFRNNEQIEASEVPLGSTEEHVPEGSALSAQSASDVHSEVEPPKVVGPADELHVLFALRQINADLDETLDVTRAAHEIAVTGVGIQPERQRQIRLALGSLPQVAVRFSDGTPPESPQSQKLSATVSTTTNAELARAWLEKQLGSRAAAEAFAERALNLTDAIAARSHALQRLAERFPVQDEEHLSSVEQRILGALRTDHATALVRATREFRITLKQTLKSGRSADTALPIRPATSWHATAHELSLQTREVEKLTAELVGGTHADGAPSMVAAQLQARLDEIERLATACAARGGERAEARP